MRNVRLGIVLMLLLPAPALSATPEIRATITSDPGDPVGIGRQYTLTVHDGTWNGYGGDFNHDGLIDTVFVNFGGSNGTGWNFEFSTQHMNAGLLPGFYDKAGLAPFETRGYPTMSVKRGSGCDALLGNFTILEARFENSKVQPGILSFAVAFEQHCRANDPALRGILLYNYTTPSDLVILTRPPAERLPVGRPFSLAFEALGGVPPYSWDAGEGRMLGIARFEEPHLPPGLALDTTGTLSGTPAVPGRFNFSVTVTDSAGRKTSEAFRIETEIRDSAPPVSELHMESEKGDWIGHGSTFDFRDTVAPQVTQRQEAVFQIQSWFVRFSMRRTLRDLAPGMYDNAMRDSFEDWGRPGMSISGDGRGCNILSGSFVILNYEADFSGPIARLNSFAARFEQHCEGWSPALRGHLYYKYEAPAHTSIVSFPELPEAGATQSYGQTLVAAGGEGPYTWDLVGEDLPAGLVLSADGKLSGVPDKPGLYSFRIRATDSQGVQSVREFSLEVITPLAIAVPTPLNPAVLLKPYSVSLEAVGGTPPYSWSIHNEGAYRVSPPGLSLSPDGVLAGIPFVSSTHYVDVQVTDAKSRTANG